MTPRDKNGRFIKGHSGNPKGGSAKKRSASYLAAFNCALTIKDMKAIVAKAVTQAKAGDKDARRFLADYALGRPKQRLELGGSVDLGLENAANRFDQAITRLVATRSVEGDSGGES